MAELQRTKGCVGGRAQETLKLSELGAAASEIRGENELWLAAALMQPELALLPPAQLAAVVACLLCPETLSRNNVWCMYSPSQEVLEVVRSVEPARQRLQLLQDRVGMRKEVAVDVRLAGLVEAWASGADWTQIMADTSLDEGDVVRVLRRTADFLSQLKLVPALSEGMRTSASQATRLVDRAPISELLVP
ncbi:hypothetical protein CYMTET_31515 [Cymbomonas tetramitiformis]|uniref:ATP-dependent RNA helicase Ski2/MTR4 C-terminal domain-containing protein n=1 Tax=Cymbomonas tetramitiformis TaxID=36881 RepID=A0AAE0KT59_9CHLO|nr:hypothetical protein CYMTET_31515 [Cymbomonas tetramitiformis]